MTLYLGEDDDIFVKVFEGRVPEPDRLRLRREYGCDHEDNESNYLFFRELDGPVPLTDRSAILNVDDMVDQVAGWDEI